MTAHACRDRSGIERLFDEIERPAADRIDRHGDITAAGNDQDRRRIALGIELVQHVEPGTAGQLHVDENAARRARLAMTARM